MISVAEAKRIISEHTRVLPSVKMFLPRAAAMVLAEDVYASVNVPAFAQSSMDGYAFSFSTWASDKSLKIAGEVAAGSGNIAPVSPGNAVRIFTGAPVPPGADTVVMQEKVRIENGRLVLEDSNVVQGLNIRDSGSEIKAGELALKKDTFLTPAAIGFLAGIGVAEVLVYPPPHVSFIVTGNELQSPGQPLLYGQVYESNSFLLQAALKQLGFAEAGIYRVPDNLEKLTSAINAALPESDIIFLTGGISVGDYDFVAAAAEKNGVEKIFHKIKQRPGKPLYFGKKGHKLVFGLPGNPASVLTCFYEYAEPVLRKLTGQHAGLRTLQVPLAEPVKKAAGLTHFLKGEYNGTTVVPLKAQESYRLSSFARANCLIKIDEEVTSCEKGEIVEIHLLPV